MYILLNQTPFHEDVLMEVSSQLHAPVTLSQAKKAPVPTGEKAGWATEPVWTQQQRRKIPSLPCPARN